MDFLFATLMYPYLAGQHKELSQDNINGFALRITCSAHKAIGSPLVGRNWRLFGVVGVDQATVCKILVP